MGVVVGFAVAIVVVITTLIIVCCVLKRRRDRDKVSYIFKVHLYCFFIALAIVPIECLFVFAPSCSYCYQPIQFHPDAMYSMNAF